MAAHGSWLGLITSAFKAEVHDCGDFNSATIGLMSRFWSKCARGFQDRTELEAMILHFLRFVVGFVPFLVVRALFHLACTALRALSLRCSGVSFFARAGPPLSPPKRPNSTAA